ncbi:MAG: FAD-binding oxidoreductase [Acholeplasma sp.]
MQNIIKDSNRLFIGSDVPDTYQNPLGENKVYGVVKPVNESEVIASVKFANEHNIPMIARGANTGAAGSQVPINGGELIIDLSLMNKVIDIDIETMTLTVEPGILLETVQKLADEHGLMYAPDPASKTSSIGGNVATNAGGMRAIKYGATRQNVRGLTVVLADGTTLELGGKTIKDASGYDLLDLFIGSEGTLGVTTKVMLKLIPKPKYEKSMVLAFDDAFTATDTVIDILKSGFIPAALELFDRESIKFSESYLNRKFISRKGHAYILLTIDGNNLEHIHQTLEKIGNIADGKVVDQIELNTDEAKAAWLMRDSILYGIMQTTYFEMLDEVVPINKFGQMIRYTKELEQKHGIRVLNFGHSGDGNIHTIIMKDDLTDEQWQTKRQAFLDDLYDEVYRLGGLISAEHGVGYFKKEHFMKKTHPNNIQVMRTIKNALDPKNLLNPNKVFQ